MHLSLLHSKKCQMCIAKRSIALIEELSLPVFSIATTIEYIPPPNPKSLLIPSSITKCLCGTEDGNAYGLSAMLHNTMLQSFLVRKHTFKEGNQEERWWLPPHIVMVWEEEEEAAQSNAETGWNGLMGEHMWKWHGPETDFFHHVSNHACLIVPWPSMLNCTERKCSQFQKLSLQIWWARGSLRLNWYLPVLLMSLNFNGSTLRMSSVGCDIMTPQILSCPFKGRVCEEVY